MGEYGQTGGDAVGWPGHRECQISGDAHVLVRGGEDTDGPRCVAASRSDATVAS